jgi:hypothetical protein
LLHSFFKINIRARGLTTENETCRKSRIIP